jgi:1,4-alpha-glucan branching enzyme
MGSIPYTSLWTNGATGGNGFGAWQLNPTTDNGSVFWYVHSSTQNENGNAPGNASNDIDTAGVAWGVTATNGALASATRPFPSALTVGQTFQIDMDNGYINSGGSVGFALQNGSGQSVWEYYFSGGAANYTINADSVNPTNTPGFTVDGMRITFSLTSASTYSVTVLSYTPGGGAGVGTSATYTGSLLNPSGGQSITSVRLFNFNAGGGGGYSYNAYFNNLSISGGIASDNAANSGYAATGTTFRVWAPNATAMYVVGTFNGFSTNATPLYSEGNGNWSVDVPGAVNGQKYEYYLSNSTVGTNFFKQDPRARRVASVSGYCYIYNTSSFNWQGDNFTAPGLSNAVLYELNIGSFSGPNSGGTFYTATNLFPYLKQLGITAMEVMPVSEFPCCSSWGYNPVDIFAVDSDAYGGPDAFKSFVKTAHQQGLAVLLDVVHNHYGGDDTNTYGDLIYGLWQFDGESVNGYGGVYFYQDSCDAFSQTWGPKPYYDGSQIDQFIKDNITMWLDEYHVDGFRWDSIGEMVKNDCGDAIAAGATLVTNIAAMVHSYPGGKINIGEDQNYVDGIQCFDATWNNNFFFDNIQGQLTPASDASRNMLAVSNAVWENFDGGGLGGWGSVNFMENHDQCGGQFTGANRLPVDIDSSNPTGYYARKRTMLGTAINLTTAGIPMLLQGEEMLTTNDFGSNLPIDWSYTNTYSGIVSYYRDLISLRRNLTGRSSGLQGMASSIIWTDTRTNFPMIAYRRWNTGSVGDDVVVICNFANVYWPAYNIGPSGGGQLGFPHDGTWYVQVNSDWTKYCSDYGNYGSSTVTVSGGTGTVSIAPYSVLILSQNLPAAPPVPEHVTFTSVITNQISLAWIVSSSASGYIVNRGSIEIATTSNNAYTDTNLLVGVEYCYSVVATNVGGASAASPTVCATTLPATSATNLLAYWTFDEGGGSLAYDSTENANTGTVTFATNLGGFGQWIPNGMVNGAILFDGYYTEVTVPNSASLNPVNGITLAAWVQDLSGNWSTYPRFIEKGASENQYALFANGNTSPAQFEFFLAGVSNGTLVAAAPEDGAWHHLAATYDGSLVMSLYLDGQLVAQQVASGGVPVTADRLVIGADPNGNGNTFFYGNIDDVRIYGSALTPSQITQLYNIDSVGDGIADWWRQQYFGNSSTTDNTSCAACDADGTGQDNYFKYVAELNPTDPTQVFTVQIAASNQFMNLTFGPYSNNLTYAVVSSPDLVNYSGLASNPPPTQINTDQTPITETVTDLTPWPSNEFYRIQITNPNISPSP